MSLSFTPRSDFSCWRVNKVAAVLWLLLTKTRAQRTPGDHRSALQPWLRPLSGRNQANGNASPPSRTVLRRAGINPVEPVETKSIVFPPRIVSIDSDWLCKTVSKKSFSSELGSVDEWVSRLVPLDALQGGVSLYLVKQNQCVIRVLTDSASDFENCVPTSSFILSLSFTGIFPDLFEHIYRRTCHCARPQTELPVFLIGRSLSLNLRHRLVFCPASKFVANILWLILLYQIFTTWGNFITHARV